MNQKQSHLQLCFGWLECGHVYKVLLFELCSGSTKFLKMIIWTEHCQILNYHTVQMITHPNSSWTVLWCHHTYFPVNHNSLLAKLLMQFLPLSCRLDCCFYWQRSPIEPTTKSGYIKWILTRVLHFFSRDSMQYLSSFYNGHRITRRGRRKCGLVASLSRSSDTSLA